MKQSVKARLMGACGRERGARVWLGLQSRQNTKRGGGQIYVGEAETPFRAHVTYPVVAASCPGSIKESARGDESEL